MLTCGVYYRCYGDWRRCCGLLGCCVRCIKQFEYNMTELSTLKYTGLK